MYVRKVLLVMKIDDKAPIKLTKIKAAFFKAWMVDIGGNTVSLILAVEKQKWLNPETGFTRSTFPDTGYGLGAVVIAERQKAGIDSLFS